MKKFFISAAVLAFAFGASAETYVNHVANGNFEEEGWEASVPDGWTWDPWNTYELLSKLPGWQLSTGGIWNGGVQLFEEAGDDDMRPGEDMNYVHFLGYNDNGWTKIKIYQVISDLTPGRTYDLTFICAVNWPEGSDWTPDKDYGFFVAEVDKDNEGNEVAGKEISSVNLAEVMPDLGGDFEECGPFSITAPADGKIYLEFYYNNCWYEGNRADNKWMDLDLVNLYSEEEPDTSIETVAADSKVAQGVYNLQGIRVANNLEELGNQSGLYIVRTAEGAQKIVK